MLTVFDVLDRDRTLGDVRRQNDLAHARLRQVEDLALLDGGDARVERQHPQTVRLRHALARRRVDVMTQAVVKVGDLC